MSKQIAIYARVSTGEQVDLYLHQQGIDTTTAAGKAMSQPEPEIVFDQRVQW